MATMIRMVVCQRELRTYLKQTSIINKQENHIMKLPLRSLSSLSSKTLELDHSCELDG